VPFLLNRCLAVVDDALPGMTMQLLRELAQAGQEEKLREIAEEMRSAFPSVWSSGIALKGTGVLAGVLCGEAASAACVSHAPALAGHV
jgi:hypothetical protein